MPDGDVANFPTNFHLTELIENEALREKFAEEGTTFTCTCCVNNSRVVGKCATCNEYLCSNGREAHEAVAAWHDHNVTIFDASAKKVNRLA